MCHECNQKISSGLKTLEIGRCEQLTELPDLKGYNSVMIYDCPNLVRIGRIIGGDVNISNCPKLDFSVGDVKSLSLRKCGITKITDCKVTRVIDIDDCDKITEISDVTIDHNGDTLISIRECISLKTIRNVTTNGRIRISSYQDVEISGVSCKSLTINGGNSEERKGTFNLELKDVEMFEIQHTRLASFSVDSLRFCVLYNCSGIESFSEEIKGFETLYITKCPDFKKLPNIYGLKIDTDNGKILEDLQRLKMREEIMKETHVKEELELRNANRVIEEQRIEIESLKAKEELRNANRVIEEQRIEIESLKAQIRNEKFHKFIISTQEEITNELCDDIEVLLGVN